MRYSVCRDCRGSGRTLANGRCLGCIGTGIACSDIMGETSSGGFDPSHAAHVPAVEARKVIAAVMARTCDCADCIESPALH